MMENSDYAFMPPSSTSVSEDLLFFDTFSHSTSDKLNFDLVQFPSPVIIDFIKIVPLGQPIEANIPGNVRLGATNPSKCELEFFINDLTKQDAHTMTDLGKFFCSEKDTDFNPPLQIHTDGLLLRGNYRTLTLAIFGQIVTYDEKPEDEPTMMMSATSPPAQTPASPIASERDAPYVVGKDERHELLATINPEADESLGDSITSKSGELLRENSIFDNENDINDEHAIIGLVEEESNNDKETVDRDDSSLRNNDTRDMFNIRDEGSQELDYSNGSDVEAHHSTKTDTDVNNDNNSNEVNEDTNLSVRRSASRTRIETTDLDNKLTTPQEESEYDAQEWFFDIDNYIPRPLTYFPDPSLTSQEKSIEARKELERNQSDYTDLVNVEVEKVKEMFDVLGCSSESKTEDWVTLVEDLTNDISNMSLSQIINSSEMLKFLIEQVQYGLDLDLALKQRQTGFKVRHLKAGIKLATILFHCGETAVNMMLEAGIPQRVLLLYNQDQMSTPSRLLIFKCLNAACDTVDGVDHVIQHQYIWGNSELSVNELRKKLEVTNNDEIDERDNPCQSASDAKQTLTCYQYILLILMSKPTTRVMIAAGNLIKKICLYTSLSELSSLNQSIQSSEMREDSEDSVFESERFEEKSHLDKNHMIMSEIVKLMKDNCASISQMVRHLPARIQFHIKPCPNDTYLAIYKWFKKFQIIECLNLVLVQTKSLSAIDSEVSVKIRGLCLTIIQQILDSPRGAQFMLSKDNCRFTAELVRTLSQKFEPTKLRMTGMESLPDASHCRGVSLSFAACRDVGLRLSYQFKILSCLDKLFVFHRNLLSTNRSATLKTPNSSILKTEHICDPEKVLHQLFIMSNHPYGLAGIMKHFSCIGNLDCILRFLDMPDYKHLEFVRETSIDYVLELVGTFLRLNNNVLEIAEEYQETLVELSKTKDKTLATRIKSLLPWLTPFDEEQPSPLITYSEETFRQLTRIIRKSIPDKTIPFAQGLDFELPPQLITAVRILRQLCIPVQVENFIDSTFDIFSPKYFSTVSEQTRSMSLPFVDSLPRHQNYNQSWNLNAQGGGEQDSILALNLHDDSLADQIMQVNTLSKLFQPYDEEICGDLKYHYGILQVFEQEDLRRLLNTLRELTGNYPRPIYQSAALSGIRGRIVISYINSVIVLLHSITCHLIDARGKEFRDTTIISVVLETYSLLCFVPKPTKDPTLRDLLTNENLSALQSSVTISSDNYKTAQQTKKLILSILMSHTQMCLSVSESEENVISKSMWTKMLKEVAEFTLSTPVFFQHGLDVLTKILPMPLPQSSILDTLDQEQLFKNFNHRKLWSAHLHPVHQKIELMISCLTSCNQREIRSLLCYLCNQLCDLSSNAACMVAKVMADSLMICVSKISNEPGSTASDTMLSEISDYPLLVGGLKECKFAIRMLLNMISNLISNQAFKSAFINHLQVICKKDEKLLSQLHTLITAHEESKSNDKQTEANNMNDNTALSVVNIVDLIKDNVECTGGQQVATGGNAKQSASYLVPPEELTRINLIEVARKSSDRFNLSSGITKTFRLKVLMDMNARSHRVNEPSSKRFDRSTPSYSYKELMAQQSSHKAAPYNAPMRGRSRPPLRPDSFRSRPQNTSRPPSIHVDDFVDIYGENQVQGSNGPIGNRYWAKPSIGGGPYSSGGGGGGGGGSGGGPQSTSGSRAHGKSKYIKMK